VNAYTDLSRITRPVDTHHGLALCRLFAASAFCLASMASPLFAATPKPDKPAPAAKAKGSDSLDSLMKDGVADKKKTGKDNKGIDSMLMEVQKPDKPQPKKEAEKDLPSLSQSDIATTMGAVKLKAHDCAVSFKSKGFAELKITVAKDGKVTAVGIGGKLAGTPVAECVDKVTRAAKFPESKGLTFDYRLDVR
jgi:hypothetical protein